MSEPLLGSLRLPPAYPQAEQSLLGAILANNKAYEMVSEYLRPHHFCDPMHGRIFAAIGHVIDKGGVADPVTLLPVFQNDPEMAEMPDRGYLGGLLGAMVSILSARDYGRVILDAWVRRELIAATEDIYNRCFAPEVGETGNNLLEALEARLIQIAEGAGDVAPVTSAGESVRQALELTQSASERQSGIAGVTCGYPSIDAVISGLQPTRYVLIGARPSMGKTGLGLGIAARAAAAGTPTLFWSGEMGAEQLGARMAAAHAGINTVSVFSGRKYEAHADADPRLADKLSNDDWAMLIGSERAARSLPLWIDARGGLTVAALRARARRMRRTHKLGLIVIDYVQLMRPSEGAARGNRNEQLTEISAAIKAMLMELRIPAVVLAQLNRESEKREDKQPQLSDLRDAGALEQDADTVMFIHRPHYYLTRAGHPVQREKEDSVKFDARVSQHHAMLNSTKGVAQISVAKNRQGPTGMTKLRFRDETTWFFDGSEADNDPAWVEDLMGAQNDG